MKYPNDFINKVINGDCIEVMKNIPDKSVTCVVTDIPYGEVNDLAGRNAIRNLNKGVADVVNFNMSVLLNELCRICRGSFYIFCGTNQVSEIRKFFSGLNLIVRHGFWEKDNPSPINSEHHYLSAVENIIYAKYRGALFNGSYKKLVWHTPIVVDKIHPTQKPTGIIVDMITTSSDRGDIILDPFFGSGTVGVVAQHLGRSYIGIELNFDYYQGAVTRLAHEEKMFCD